MRYLTFVLLAAAATCVFATEEKRPPAYAAELVATSGGQTMRSRIWSNGTIFKTQSLDGTSGQYIDYDRKLSWLYGTGFPCLQMPAQPEGHASTTREEIVGSETIDGHPTKKVKVSSVTHDKKTATTAWIEWRASDLHDLVIRRRAEDGSFESHLEHVVLVKPDAKYFAFPNPPCKNDEALDKTRDAPQAAGGFRKVPFFDAGCKKLVPLPLTISIPSDYAIRGFGNTDNCFWGSPDDLDRVIAKDGADFEHIQRGVFWCRVSESTQFDPVHEKFINEQGPHDQWAASMKSMGLKNVTVTSKKIGTIPSTRVTGSMNGKHVYMLYLAVPRADSPAILINYHPVGKGGGADDAAWQRFLDSIEVAPK